MPKRKDLKTLRAEIGNLDDKILKLIARRITLAKKVGYFKLRNNLPIKDFKVEKEVVAKSRKTARGIGLYENMAEEVAKTLIHYSVLTQEEFHTHSNHKKKKTQKQILIAGGAGKMGRWLGRFFDSFGHQIIICDREEARAKIGDEFTFTANFIESAKASDIIILSTPISNTAEFINQLAGAKVKGLVFDICSLKTPIVKSIRDAERQGLKITSVHPMFGPNVELLSGKNIIVCETANKTICDATANLFKDTTANLIRIPLEQHDELMSYVLGLSHIVNLAFAKVLSESRFSFAELQKVSSTTFFSQLRVVAPVVEENQDLYYEIQAENSHSSKIINSMIRELKQYLDSVEGKNRDSFKKYMEHSRKYFKA